MPACREGERTELLLFALAPLNFPGLGGGVLGGSLPLAGTCESDGRENLLNRFLLRFRR